METNHSSFSELIKQYLEDNDINSSSLCRVLNDNGLDISARTLQRYKSGDIIPTYSKARTILNIIGLSGYTESELFDLLMASREEKKNESTDDILKLDRRCVIPESAFDLGENLPTGSVIDLIDDRIEDLYGHVRGAFSLYMKDLIEKDLREYILKKGDISSEG